MENIITDHFSKLNEHDKLIVINDLIQYLESNSGSGSVDSDAHISCPHCQSFSIRCNGFSKLKRQKYLCKSCNKNFSESTHRIFWWIKKKDTLIKYLYGLLHGFTVRQCAEKYGISIQTSFNWRHKLLSCIAEMPTGRFNGILELNQISFKYSTKGAKAMKNVALNINDQLNLNRKDLINKPVSVLAAKDRSGNELLKVVKMGKLNDSDYQVELLEQVKDVLIICKDFGKMSQEMILKQSKGFALKNTYFSKKIREEALNLKRVKLMKMEVMDFIRRRRGVATKYLQNYLDWYLLLNRIKNRLDRLRLLESLVFNAKMGLLAYKEIENKHILFRTKYLDNCPHPFTPSSPSSYPISSNYNSTPTPE